jgi:hypothetical protein
MRGLEGRANAAAASVPSVIWDVTPRTPRTGGLEEGKGLPVVSRMSCSCKELRRGMMGVKITIGNFLGTGVDFYSCEARMTVETKKHHTGDTKMTTKTIATWTEIGIYAKAEADPLKAGATIYRAYEIDDNSPCYMGRKSIDELKSLAFQTYGYRQKNS